MPIGKRFDIQINGKGYMLVRGEGRAWTRTGLPDTPGRRSPEDAKYGVLPDEIDHPEVWNDWSGGAFHPYRRNGENTYHWAENFDARFPRQLVHAQDLRLIADSVVSGAVGATLAYANRGINSFLNGPKQNVSNAPSGEGVVFVFKDEVSYAPAWWLNPTGLAADASAFIAEETGIVMLNQITGRAAIHGSYIYIPVASGNFMNQQVSGALASLSPMPGAGFAVEGNRLWRYHGTSKRPTFLQSAAAGADAMATANWTATLNIGDGYNKINDMIIMEDQVMIGMPNGVFAGDSSGTFVNVLPALSSQVHEDNCRDLTIHNGELIVQNIAGIFSYQPGDYTAQVDEIGPQMLAQRSPVQGMVRCLNSFGGWLYAGLWTGSNSYLLAGRRTGNQYNWHTMQRLPHIAKIHRLHFDGITVASGGSKNLPNRMWIATDVSINPTGTCPLYYFQVPRLHGNPLMQDPVFSPNFVATARIDLGNVDFGAPGTQKSYREVEVWADNLLSGYRYADIYYQKDVSGSFVYLGRVQNSPYSRLFFPNTVNGQSIELSLQSFTASPAFTPVYRSVVLRGAMRPNSVDTITAQVRIADGIRDRQGGEMRSGATMLTELRALATASQAAPVTLIDLIGAQHIVNVLPPIEEQEVYQRGEDFPEVMAQVKMSVMVYS